MARRNLLCSVVVSLAALLPSSSQAGDVVGVTITSTESVPGNILIVYVSAIHPAPACGANQTTRYAILGSEKTMVAQALLAQGTGRVIDITGKGVCDAWSDTETALYLLVR
jgi:hypothetical protein